MARCSCVGARSSSGSARARTASARALKAISAAGGCNPIGKATALGILRAGGARNAHVLTCTLRFLRSGVPQTACARDALTTGSRRFRLKVFGLVGLFRIGKQLHAQFGLFERALAIAIQSNAAFVGFER